MMMILTAADITPDERAFIADIDARFLDKQISAKIARYVAMAPESRFAAAVQDSKTLERTGYVLRGVPADARQSVHNHQNHVAKLAGIFTPFGIDSLFAAREGQIHDLPEVIAGDFTRHDQITPVEKARIEDIAARIIFQEKDYLVWRAHEDMTGSQQIWVTDCDLLEMPLHIISVIEQKYKGMQGRVEEFFPYVAAKLQTPRGREIFVHLLESRDALHRGWCSLGFRRAMQDRNDDPWQITTTDQIKMGEIRRIRDLISPAAE